MEYTVKQSFYSDSLGQRLRGEVLELEDQDLVSDLMAQGFIVEGNVNMAQVDARQSEANAQALTEASQQWQAQNNAQANSFDYNQVISSAQALAQTEAQTNALNQANMQAKGQAQSQAEAKQVASKQASTKKVNDSE